jgi:hypothetical protein
LLCDNVGLYNMVLCWSDLRMLYSSVFITSEIFQFVHYHLFKRLWSAAIHVFQIYTGFSGGVPYFWCCDYKNHIYAISNHFFWDYKEETKSVLEKKSILQIVFLPLCDKHQVLDQFHSGAFIVFFVAKLYNCNLLSLVMNIAMMLT